MDNRPQRAAAKKTQDFYTEHFEDCSDSEDNLTQVSESTLDKESDRSYTLTSSSPRSSSSFSLDVTEEEEFETQSITSSTNSSTNRSTQSPPAKKLKCQSPFTNSNSFIDRANKYKNTEKWILNQNTKRYRSYSM